MKRQDTIDNFIDDALAAARDDAHAVAPADALSALADCTLCGRLCHVDRLHGESGYCGQTATLRAARAALHFWEEPCISGTGGSGAVFFSGCSMRCVFCQNHDIALGTRGMEISSERLSEIFLELQAQGAHNINLVTPTHFIPQIVIALTRAKSQGLTLPIVYNTGSLETIDALKMLDGLIDVYLPDLKYYSPEISTRYANAPHYFTQATAAIAEMYRQVGAPKFVPLPGSDGAEHSGSDDADLSESGLMQRGMIVRHLLLPGCSEDSKQILRYLYETYHDRIYISIMNQYTPLSIPPEFPELTRKVRRKEYDKIVDYAILLGIEQAFIQDGETAKESFIPEFGFQGLL
ncbi:MAG: radical SAM protein [Lachnospiraceae bacterium]|nr:radical SAM protein [Lachnospiraceae bacterium]